MRRFSFHTAAYLTSTLLFLPLALTGCAPQEQKTADAERASANAPQSASGMTGEATPSAPGPAGAPAPAGGGGAAAAPPMMGMMGGGGGGASDPSAPLSKTPKLDENIAAALKKGDKKAIADAYAKRGTFRMYDDKAGTRIKYRAALDDYRKALKADPANPEATKNKKTIEDVYRSMGRPIPGEENTMVQ